MAFHWHAGPIGRETPLDAHYRNTQNVRRFLIEHCGPAFSFDRPFMAWIKATRPLTMGEVADEWLRRQETLVGFNPNPAIDRPSR